MGMRALFGLLLAVALSLASGAAQAHPHVWITFKSELLYGPDGKEVWRMIGGYDWSSDKAKALVADATKA